jgi:hypothetical protein
VIVEFAILFAVTAEAANLFAVAIAMSAILTVVTCVSQKF